MAFYYVDLKPVGEKTSQQDKTISFLFPSSIVREIFIEGKIFSAEELEKALEIAENKCIERLTKLGEKYFAKISFVPAKEIIQNELEKIDRNRKYEVVEKSEISKRIERRTKGVRRTF